MPSISELVNKWYNERFGGIHMPTAGTSMRDAARASAERYQQMTTQKIRIAMPCPKCGGKVRRLGGVDVFCLDCDWDNMEARQW